MIPEAADVAAFLGRSDDTTVVAAAGESLPIITAMVRSYTRDSGFDRMTAEPSYDIAAVITTATARLMTNPEQIPVDVGNVSIRGGFTGWSLAELFVLNRYRKRAM